MGDEPLAGQEERLDHSTVIALTAMALGVFLVANDFTALSVAIPNLEHDLHTTLNRAQWVINGYALVFGVLIVTGGRLADIYGRKRVFLIGGAVFGTFSLAAGLMPNINLLIACRGLMGVGGALMWPAILGMTYSLLPESKAGLAGGLILGVAGLGNAVGPMLGGFLTDVFSWRWVFFINVPITVFAMLVIWRTVDESKVADGERRMDGLGILTVSVGIVAILVALDEGTDAGFGDPLIVALFVVGLVFLALFMRVEHGRGDRALIPPDVLRNQVFAAACVAVLLMSAIFFAALLYLPQYMQNVLGYSALGSGAGLLPLMAVFAATSFVAGSLYTRVGGRTVVASGAVCLAVGMFVLAALDERSTYAAMVPGMVVLGIGVGLFYSSITTVAVTALDPSRSSLAGGVVYMCQIAGGAVGLGFNTAIVSAGSDLADGIRTAFLVNGVLALVGLVVCLRFLRAPSSAPSAPEHPRALRGRHRAHA